MRVALQPADRQQFFTSVAAVVAKPWSEEVAKICGSNSRTVRDWHKGRYTIPLVALKKIAKQTGVPMPPIDNKLDQYWYVHKGASRGGQRRQKLHGNLGTPEGRRLGGLHSIASNRKLGTPGFNTKKASIPSHSTELAEFTGALLGDGGINQYQVIITLHKTDDYDYAHYVARLGEHLFSIKPTIRERESTNNVVFNSLQMVNYLTTMGLPIGSKVRHQVAVPTWITKRSDYTKACLRGLIDTDGSFYVDKHRYKNRVYVNAALHFSNRSLPLLAFVKDSLTDLGFHPTQRTEYAIFLRRENEIKSYFAKVGPSNAKHKNKFKQYIKKR